MIFPGYFELIDINEYRDSAMKRKMSHCEAQGRKFGGVSSLEFEILEAIERTRDYNSDFPYVEVIEKGDAKDARRSADPSPRVFCDFTENGDLGIFYDWQMPVKIGRYVGLIFDEPLKDWQIKLREKDGIEYKPFEHSIYDFPAFQRFAVCKFNLTEYVRKMAGWFIGLHELGHIVNGHLLLMNEVNAQKVSIDLNTRRALEIHSDITAATLLLQIMGNWQKYVGVRQPVPQLNGKNPGITYCDEVTFGALAVYIALRMFLTHEQWDEYTVAFHEMDREKHPLTELRMAIVYNVFLQGIIDLGETEEEKNIFANSFYQAVRQFEDFIFINQSKSDENKLYYKPTELLRTKKGKKYYHTLFDSVLKLNDLLKRYSTTQRKVTGQWADYETLPEKIYWM